MMAAAGANLVAWSLQAALVVAAAALVSTVLRPGAPGLRYAWWRLVALGCVALPWLQPHRDEPAPSAGPASDVGAAVVESISLPGDAVAAALPSSLWWPALAVAAAGLTLRLVWLALGASRLRRLRREGAPAPPADHATLQSRLGTRADVRYLDTIDRPVTFGLRRPVVLLPSSLAASPVEIRDAVIAHELWHVRRRDWAWLLVEEGARAVLWWHPAWWWLISRIQLAREELVDALTVASTGRRRAYLQALARFSDPSPLHPAPAFAWRRHLLHRMRLVAREDPMTARRLVLTTLVATLFVGTASWIGVSRFPLVASPLAAQIATAPGPHERAAYPVTPENPVPRRVHSVAPDPVDLPEGFGTTQITLRVTLDHAGVPVEVRFLALSSRYETRNVHVAGQRPASIAVSTLTPPEGGSREADGVAALHAIDAMVHAAVRAVSQWRYDAPSQAPIAFDTTVGFGPDGTAGSPAGWADGALRVGGNVAPPRKVVDARPIYPPDARAAGISGIVIAEIRIASNGRVEAARIVRSIPELDQAALDAIHQWEFTPVLMNGQAVPVLMTVTVQFSLQ